MVRRERYPLVILVLALKETCMSANFHTFVFRARISRNKTLLLANATFSVEIIVQAIASHGSFSACSPESPTLDTSETLLFDLLPLLSFSPLPPPRLTRSLPFRPDFESSPLCLGCRVKSSFHLMSFSSSLSIPATTRWKCNRVCMMVCEEGIREQRRQ